MSKNSSYLNAILTVIAVLLGLNLMVQLSGTGVSTAHAAHVAEQPEDSNPITPPFNSTEQRRQMILQLQEINRRLMSLEARLDRGVNTKVTEMPVVRVQGDAR